MLTQLLLLSLIAVSEVRGVDLQITWYTIDGGGVMFSAGEDLQLSGTIGQMVAGPATIGEFELSGGFWYPLAKGDCNNDSGINLFDYGDFSGCAFGPDDGLPDVQCHCADFDGDGDADLADYQSFLGSFGGE